jgi:hypothetical protein
MAGARQYLPAEFHYALNHFLGTLADSQDLPGGQGDNRVRRDFDMLDQVGVQHHRHVIETG